MPVAAIAAATVAGAVISSRGASKAAKAQQRGAEAAAASSDRAAMEANALQREMFQQTRADQAPWRQHGVNALNRIEQLNRGNMQGFYTSPGYQFRLGEGQKAVQNSAASRGLLGSGGTLKALTRFGQGLASEEYGNYYNRLAGQAGVGQAATNMIGQLGAQTAGTMGNNLMQAGAIGGNAMMQAGNARASGYAGQANALNSGIQNGLFLAGMQQGWFR